MKLTPKQALFVAEYLIDANATRAAIAVGFSPASASVTGAKLIKNRKIAAIIAERQARSMAKLEVTEERVKQELAKLAFHDAGKLYDETGKLKPVYELDDMTRAAVVVVEVDETGTGRNMRTVTKKVKLADKRGALELLGKHLKMFTDLHQHSGRLTLEQLVSGNGESSTSGGLEEDQRVA